MPVPAKYSLNVDSNGLFVTAPQYASDGGDSLANNASFELASTFCMNHQLPTPAYTEAVLNGLRPWKPMSYSWKSLSGGTSRMSAEQLLGSKSAQWVRNPNSSQWWSNPQTTSRDQLIPTMLALGLNKEYSLLWATQWRILVRTIPVFPWIPLMWAPNIYNNGADGVSKGAKVPDTFLGHLHLFIRCWGWWAAPLYPLLLVTDLLLLVAAIVDVLGAENKDPQNCDDRNGINCHIAAINACPTPLSWLARKIYSKYRPPTYASIPGVAGTGNVPYQAAGAPVETNHVMGALRLYFWENNPVIAEAYRPIIEKYFR